MASMANDLIAVRAATALVGPRLEAVNDAALIIADGHIEAAGPASEVTVPIGAEIVDAAEHTLLPGFIDAHVHIGFYDPIVVLRGGVTTVRDLAWPEEQIWPLVRASASPAFQGPTILAAGPMLTVEGGYPTRAAWAPPGTGLVIGSRGEAQPAVERLASAGASVIKVALNPAAGPTLDGETLRAIVECAHHHDLKVTGHTFGLEELDKALDAGMDELAHMLMSRDSIADATIARMVEQGMTVVPTLSCFFGRDQRVAIENLERFLEAGGHVVYGTDLGNQGPSPGIDRREVSATAKAGMSGHDIIRSASVDSAKWLGLEGVGALAPGMDADVVGVKGNPLDDHNALTKVAMVWRKGKRVR